MHYFARVQRHFVFIVTAIVVVLALVVELRTSWIQSLLFRALDRNISYKLQDGPSQTIQYPKPGPYDWTLGYARLPELLTHLRTAGYRVDAQTRDSELASFLYHGGVYPIYGQKDQAGLRIVDPQGNILYSFRRPEHVYQAYSDIPPLVVDSLLFIENRHMLDPNNPTHNPAVEWDRLSKALVDYGIHIVDRGHPVIGGSTLATQLEKLRHSPGGRTHSPFEKLRQMTSASLGCLPGRIVDARYAAPDRARLHQFDSARGAPGYGDVQGLGDGLWAWYGTDLESCRRPCLAAHEAHVELDRDARARPSLPRGAFVAAGAACPQLLSGGRSADIARANRSLSAGAGRTGIISPRCAIWPASEYSAPCAAPEQRRRKISSRIKRRTPSAWSAASVAWLEQRPTISTAWI